MTVNNHFSSQRPNETSSATARRMIFRHPGNRSLGGVCAGLADFLGWDPVFVRALWVVATFATSGAGFLVYLLLWLLLPVGTQAAGQLRSAAIQFNNLSGSWMAKALLVLGGLWLLSNLGILPALAEMTGGFLRIFFWPLLLIAIGYMLLKGRGAGLQTRFDAMRNQASESARSDRGAGADLGARLPIRRSRSNRMVLGLCGGLSDRLGIDANLIRLACVILGIGSMGLGVLVYFAVALFVPEEGSHYAPDMEDMERTAAANGHNGDFQVVPIAQAAQRIQSSAANAAPDVSPISNDIVNL